MPKQWNNNGNQWNNAPQTMAKIKEWQENGVWSDDNELSIDWKNSDWDENWTEQSWHDEFENDVDDEKVLEEYLTNGQDVLARFQSGGLKRRDRKLRKTKNWQ